LHFPPAQVVDRAAFLSYRRGLLLVNTKAAVGWPQSVFAPHAIAL